MTYTQPTANKGKTDAPASFDPDRTILRMMQTVDFLRGVMERETQALSASDSSGFLDLQDEKVEAARLFQTETALMMDRKDDLKNANPALKAQLEHTREEFAKTAAENLEALERMRKSTKRLGDRIMSSARVSA